MGDYVLFFSVVLDWFLDVNLGNEPIVLSYIVFFSFSINFSLPKKYRKEKYSNTKELRGQRMKHLNNFNNKCVNAFGFLLV